MNISVGKVVELKKGWKLSGDDYLHSEVLRIGKLLSKSERSEVQKIAYEDWHGFTHAIIFDIEYGNEMLYEGLLYDPKNCLMHCDSEEEVVLTKLKEELIERVIDRENLLARPLVGYLSD